MWGTFSVKDHRRGDAFAREALLFDRLVIPYPVDARERDRWKMPNPDDPQETWDPDRLVLAPARGSSARHRLALPPTPMKDDPAAGRLASCGRRRLGRRGLSARLFGGTYTGRGTSALVLLLCVGPHY